MLPLNRLILRANPISDIIDNLVEFPPRIFVVLERSRAKLEKMEPKSSGRAQ